ncbi:MAG: hypothetical protein IPI53_16245 [Saprospiraceae bacterium]|nr:hypothetical protein [Saprospiraceae bacterium]
MSQFDFPRINFHGQAILDTATANNGNYEPRLTMFDQENSTAFMPPRCYLGDTVYSPPSGVRVLTDKKGNKYVPIDAVSSSNYQKWATTPLGYFTPDQLYWTLYEALGLKGANPGYWNYFGDLSMSLEQTLVTGITVPLSGGNIKTFISPTQEGCPSDVASIFGSELSFNNDYFDPNSKTSAYLSDVDSIGQMCTQIFCGTAGLYKTDSNGNPITFFAGNPVKSTARWMNLNKVLNYSDQSLLPMGGSACFYAMINVDPTSSILSTMSKYAGKNVTALFLKLMIHEVHEIREPDYTKLPVQNMSDVVGNQAAVSKNPARVSVSGSITPYFEGDMKTGSISRLLKHYNPDIQIKDPKILHPITKNGTILSVPSEVKLAPAPFIHNQNFNVVSIDLLNTISEYGTNPGELPDYAGDGDIPAYTTFQSNDFGTFYLTFQPDRGGNALVIKKIDFDEYNLSTLLSIGGIIDCPVSTGSDFSTGIFNLSLDGTRYFFEDEYYITSDQMGNYAQQNQSDFNYMSDGLPKSPCTLKVFFRGKPVTPQDNLKVMRQNINLRTGQITNNINVHLYNNISIPFAVDTDGCMTYAFLSNGNAPLQNDMKNLFDFIMNNSLIVVRTLESKRELDPYINGSIPITWDVVYNNVFSTFKTLYPIMDAIIPFTEANWSNSFILSKMLNLMSEENWNQPLYMPITRDLSDQQLQLLNIWANQNINPSSALDKNYINNLLTSPPESPKLFFSMEVENIATPTHFPSLQSFAFASYNGYWVFIGGMTIGFHGTSNNPFPFLASSANTQIWIVDIDNGITFSVPVPEQYLTSLAVSNPQFFQVEQSLFFCGGYTVSDINQPAFNTTSNNFFKIDLDKLISYAKNNGNGPTLNEIFPLVLQDTFVRVTGGEMVVVNNRFFIIGGQDFEGKYSPGATGNYTNAIRCFELIQNGNLWTITNKKTITDPVNLHRRDFNLVPYITSDGSTEYIILGGVFTSDGLSYNNPVYLKGLKDGNPMVSVGSFTQKCNQYTCAVVPMFILSGGGMCYSLLGGISYMMYDTSTNQLVIGDHGVPMPFSNIIDVVASDLENSLEFVQLPPEPLLPGYIGSNASFIPLPEFALDGHPNIVDLNKVFKTPFVPTTIGYMYGGILSNGPTSGTTAKGHINTYANSILYSVKIILPTQEVTV